MQANIGEAPPRPAAFLVGKGLRQAMNPSWNLALPLPNSVLFRLLIHEVGIGCLPPRAGENGCAGLICHSMHGECDHWRDELASLDNSNTHRSQGNTSVEFYILHTHTTTTHIEMQYLPRPPGSSLAPFASHRPHPQDSLCAGLSIIA